MTIKDQVKEWIEDRLYILPYKDPENRIFSYGSWLPSEEIEIYKRIINKYKDEFPNMIIIADNHGFQPLILWDKSNSSECVSLIHTGEWDENDRARLKKCMLEIFILKKRITSFQERENLLKGMLKENQELLSNIMKSPDFIGEIKKFVFDTLEEMKKDIYEYSTDPSSGTFGQVRLVQGLERERRVLEKRLDIFNSLYYKSNGIKRSNKSN